MKKYILLFVCFLIFASQSFAQIDTTVIGEIRYKNGGPLFWKNFDYDFFCKSSLNGEEISIKALVGPKETFDKSDQGTEVILHLNKMAFTNSGYATVIGRFYVSLKNNYKLIKAETDPIQIDLGNAVKLNEYTFKLNYPMEISSPEKFSLIMMINYLDDKFNSPNSKDGYSSTIEKLENYKDNYFEVGKKNSTLIDFYKFLVFTDEYVGKTSFFNEEGQKLKSHINDLNFEISDSISDKNIPNNKYQDLVEDLMDSNNIYIAYQDAYSKIKDYNSQLQLILFLYSR